MKNDRIGLGSEGKRKGGTVSREKAICSQKGGGAARYGNKGRRGDRWGEEERWSCETREGGD